MNMKPCVDCGQPSACVEFVPMEYVDGLGQVHRGIDEHPKCEAHRTSGLKLGTVQGQVHSMAAIGDKVVVNVSFELTKEQAAKTNIGHFLNCSLETP